MMKFRIKFFDEISVIQFDHITEQCKVLELKEYLKKTYRQNDFHLSLNGKDPLDDEQTIGQSGLVNGDRIYLLHANINDDDHSVDRPLTLDDVTDPRIYPRLFDRLIEINQPKEDFDYIVVILHALMLESGFQMDGEKNNDLKSSKKSSTFFVTRYRHKLCDEERYRCSLAIMKTDGLITVDGVIASISQACGKLSLQISEYFHRRDSSSNEKAILPYQNLRLLSCLFKDNIAHRLLCKLLEESGRKSSATLTGLPNELKLRIAKFLPIASVLKLQLTCREIYNTLNDQLLWFHLCQRDFDVTAINASPEPKDWPKIYRQLYSQKQRYQTKSSSPVYPLTPVFAYPPTHRLVFPDPNNAVPPAFHPYPPAIFRPIPPPGLFPSATVIPFPPGFHPVWLG